MLDVRFLPFPELRTERLLLRRLRDEDAQAVFTMRSDVEVMRHIGRPRATTVQDATDLMARMGRDLEANEAITWAIALHGNDTLIGTIGYYRLKKEHHRGEVGYMLSPAHWRKGIMGEALDAVVRCGFERIGFHSIEAITDPRNTASNRLLETRGFAREGLFRENFFWEGEFLDSAVWSRLAPRW